MAIPVIFVWRDTTPGRFKDDVIRRHSILPALPAVGDLVIPPGATSARNVRAREWDCSQNNGATSAVIHIVLDD